MVLAERVIEDSMSGNVSLVSCLQEALGLPPEELGVVDVALYVGEEIRAAAVAARGHLVNPRLAVGASRRRL